jgi:hypothetical protein
LLPLSALQQQQDDDDDSCRCRWWRYFNLAKGLEALFLAGACHPHYAAQLQAPITVTTTTATTAAGTNHVGHDHNHHHPTGEAAAALGLARSLCSPKRLAEALLTLVVEGWTVRVPPSLRRAPQSSSPSPLPSPPLSPPSSPSSLSSSWATTATVKPPPVLVAVTENEEIGGGRNRRGYEVESAAAAAFLVSMVQRVDCHAAYVLLLEGPQRAHLDDALAHRLSQDMEAAFDVFFQRGHVLH